MEAKLGEVAAHIVMVMVVQGVVGALRLHPPPIAASHHAFVFVLPPVRWNQVVILQEI